MEWFGWDTKYRMDPKLLENKDTIKEIPTDDLSPLEIVVNIEGDGTV